MRRILFAFAALLAFACFANAYDWFNFSTWGSTNTVINASNTTELETYFVKTGNTQVSVEREKLLFASGKPSLGSDFYGVYFDPPLNTSVMNDLRNRTFFKWKGAQYVLLYFSAKEHKAIFGIEGNYTNESTTIYCNWTEGIYLVNVSNLDQNLSYGQTKLRTQLDFRRGNSTMGSLTLAEGEFKQDLITKYAAGVLKITPGIWQNNTFLVVGFYSQIYTLTQDAFGKYFCNGLGQAACDIEDVQFDSNGSLAGFSTAFQPIMGGAKPIFNLTQDCAYMPELVCKDSVKRIVDVSTWSTSILTVDCPYGTGTKNITNNTVITYTYCFVDSHCNRGNPCESFSCSATGNETINLTIGNYSGNTTKACRFANLTGCVSNGTCISTGTRVTDYAHYWYCNGSMLLPQGEGGAGCSANYQCKSNSCASGGCSTFATPTPVTYPTAPPSGNVTPNATVTPSPPPECVESSVCNDGNPCTDEYCIDGRCMHKPLSGCAFGAACREYGSVDIFNGRPSYCAPDAQWYEQKGFGTACGQNYECRTYKCSNARCETGVQPPAVVPGPLGFIAEIFQAILNFFSQLFGGK